MAQRGRRALPTKDVRELVDLYAWGMEVWVIGAFYDIHKRTVKEYVKKSGGKVRPSGRVPYKEGTTIRSIRQQKPAAAAPHSDPFEDVYRLVREHARVLRDTHTARRLADASTRSYQVAAS